MLTVEMLTHVSSTFFTQNKPMNNSPKVWLTFYVAFCIQWNLYPSYLKGPRKIKWWLRESILMCHKHDKTKNENVTFFYFGLRNEQIKASFKYFSTNNFLQSRLLVETCVNSNFKMFCSSCSPMLYAQKNGIVYTQKQRVHFDKTRLWFGFKFVSLFTTIPWWSMHNPQMPPLQPAASPPPHLAEAWHYRCNSTGRIPLLYIPKTSHDFIAFSQKL
jgi:hypothetical protein